ncbi:MAG: DUF4917 family protein [Solirubrobacterales bacterium]
MAGEPDGTLLDWREIADAYPWDTLLLGNGLSINVWEPFGYGKLYDRAKIGGLSSQDRKLFAHTPNFERVLADLLTAIRVNRAYGRGVRILHERYRSIQLAFVQAVREVHLNRSKVPEETRMAINAEMRRFEWVFTTSYDLIVYWAMAAGGFEPFMDHFRYGGRCEFDPDRARVPGNRIPVYFLHGALHLVTGASGATWKLRLTGLERILDQFGEPIAGDPEARPLLVTEGSAADKMFAIEENAYLSHALKRLRRRYLPVVVFGSSLSEQDSHLTEALSEHPERPVAISMLPGPRQGLHAEQVDICGRLEAEPVLFYDATTHPLGRPGLRVPSG